MSQIAKFTFFTFTESWAVEATITGQMSIYVNEMTNALFTKKKDSNNNSNIEHLVCDFVLRLLIWILKFS